MVPYIKILVQTQSKELYDEGSVGRRLLDDAQVPLEGMRWRCVAIVQEA
jgi:hypothetical protein